MPKTVSPHELQRLLAADPALPLLDVRTPAEYAGARLPQARNVPLDRLNPGTVAALYADGAAPLPEGKPVYFLCQAGKRATLATEAFAAAGHDVGIVVEGGLSAWTAAGLPVEQGAGGVISLERQVRIGAGSLVLLGVLLGHFVHPGFYWLSGFVGAGLVFAGVTDFCGMALVLAKCPWNGVEREPASLRPIRTGK